MGKLNQTRREMRAALESFDYREVVRLAKFDKRLLSVRDLDGNTPLHLASDLGESYHVRTLLKLGAKIESENRHGHSPLFIALNRHRRSAFKILIHWGAMPESVGATSLHAASLRLRPKAFLALLKRNRKDANAKDRFGLTPLHWAAMAGKIDNLSWLVSYGAEPNAQNKNGGTALHEAVVVSSKMVETLLSYGANPFLRDNGGWTALHNAGFRDFRGKLSIVESLLKAGISVNTQTNDGHTPLHVVQIPAVAKLLIKNGANLEARNSRGETPIHTAAHYYNTRIVKVLLGAGVSVNSRTRTLETPLHKACFSKRTVSFLIYRGADIYAKNLSLEYPLHMAAYEFNSTRKSLKALLKAAYPIIDVIDSRGLTPLHLAVREKNEIYVRLLLKYGANVNARDICSTTPLAIAQALRLKKIAALLLARGATL